MSSPAKAVATAANKLADGCLFCKIIRGEIPCRKIFETEKSLAFLDIGPLSQGHTLVIPKYHGERLTDVPAPYLAELLPIAARVAEKVLPHVGAEDFNILQNNGRRAHQQVMHVHVHMIPKPKDDDAAGLGIRWPGTEVDEGVVGSLMKALDDTSGGDWRAELREELGESAGKGPVEGKI